MSIRPWTQRLLRERITRWQTTFPYHWDADDYVSRRQMLRLAVLSSGALFAATAGIVGLNYARPNRSIASQKAIIAAADLPVGKVHYFEYPAAGEQAILLNLPQTGFVAYSGKCTHLSCAVYYREDEKKLICPCHDGAFDPQTGEPIAGPPQRPLPKIKVQQDGTMIYAVEESPVNE